MLYKKPTISNAKFKICPISFFILFDKSKNNNKKTTMNRDSK